MKENNQLVDKQCKLELESCHDSYILGFRINGIYKVKENNQLVDKQCKLELESCHDSYNLGFRINGIYKVKENNQLVDKQCKLELESCHDSYNLGFRINGIYKVKENNQLVDKQCKLELESCHDSYNLGFRINGIYKVKENNQLVDKQCKLELESCLDVYNLDFRTDGIYKVKENNQLVYKQCKLELESCLDVYNLGFRINGIYKLNVNGQIQDTECKFDIADCKSWYNLGYTQNGLYYIALPTSGLKEVRCDMETDGGGWIVIQRRFDGSVDFFKEWDEYREGFGTMEGEFWLGNKYLYEMANIAAHEWYFKATAFDNEVGISRYGSFRVASEENKFQAKGTKTMGITSLVTGYGFSTHNNDNDGRGLVNCAAKNNGGGFWYSTCGAFFPNGEYKHQGNVAHRTGIFWNAFKGFETSMKETLMLIRKE